MKAEDSWQANTSEEESGQNPEGTLHGAETDVTTRPRTKAEWERESGLMDVVCERGNLKLAYQRVVKNKGAAGVDGIGIDEFDDHLKQHWPTIKVKLLAGGYMPHAVRRVDIDKPQGGTRTLGISQRTEGTPQGGPLSPLLSNILLTELDRELERRGHAFCRYADDCNIYVRSQQAGERVMASITRFLADTRKRYGECSQERGGAAVEEEVSGLQFDVAQGSEAEDCADQPETAGRQNP